MFPALGIRFREQRRWRCCHLSDRGDQAITSPCRHRPVRNLILDHPDAAGLVLVQILPGAAASMRASRALPRIFGFTSTDE